MPSKIYNLMKMICSAHQKRGEEVVEFNLSPSSMKAEKITYFLYNKKVIPVVSEGWNRIGGYYYKEYSTSEGIILSPSLTYRIK